MSLPETITDMEPNEEPQQRLCAREGCGKPVLPIIMKGRPVRPTVKKYCSRECMVASYRAKHNWSGMTDRTLRHHLAMAVMLRVFPKTVQTAWEAAGAIITELDARGVVLRPRTRKREELQDRSSEGGAWPDEALSNNLSAAERWRNAKLGRATLKHKQVRMAERQAALRTLKDEADQLQAETLEEKR